MLEEEGIGKDYKDGDIIFRENDLASEMYVILMGKVKVIKESLGVETVLATLGEGEIFGEMALFDQRPRSATVKVVGMTRIASMTRDEFLSLVKIKPVVAIQVLEKMSKRLRQVDDEIQKLNIQDHTTKDHIHNFMKYRGMI